MVYEEYNIDTKMLKNKLPSGSNQIDTCKKSEGKKYFFFANFFLEKEKCKDGNKD